MANDEMQKTVDDICQKIRDAGIPELADRILAVRKRERAEIEALALSIGGIVESSRHTQKPQGNAAAMREALLKLRAEIGKFYNNEWIPYDAWQGCDDMISHALSAPPRQCEVGTALEQAQRFHDFCVGNSSGINGMCKSTCPCIDCFDKCQCLAKWAQMLYAAEEGAGE